jgi:anti-sigma regulatory factor (Ser/Thr protein kinase)
VVARTEEIPVISEFIEKLMKTYFDMKKIMEVQLAAEEACTNIALYAYPGKLEISTSKPKLETASS